MFTQPTLSRRDVVAGVAAIGGGLLPTTSPLLAATATAIPGFSERFADVNGVRLHYFIGGKGSPVVLLAADPKRSVSETDRQLYAEAYAQPGGMRAGFEYFRNFERDAQDFAQLSAKPLVKGVVIEGSGHWLMDEAPGQVIPLLVAFVDS